MWADLGKVVSYSMRIAGQQKEGTGVSISCKKGTLIIQSYARHGWKISSLPTGKTLMDERPSITLTGRPSQRTLAFKIPMCEREVINVTSETLNMSGMRYDKQTATLTFNVQLPSENGKHEHRLFINY